MQKGSSHIYYLRMSTANNTKIMIIQSAAVGIIQTLMYGTGTDHRKTKFFYVDILLSVKQPGSLSKSKEGFCLMAIVVNHCGLA